MFRFADVPLSLSGMTRIQGTRVYLRAPTMEDWPEWAELRARSRAFLTPWEPTWPDDSLGRDHFRRRLRQQVREWRAGEAYGLFVFLNDKRRLAGFKDESVRGGVGPGHERQILRVVHMVRARFRRGLDRVDAANARQAERTATVVLL